MNYERVYSQLIQHRQINILTNANCEYYEKHHIIMKSLGGNNDSSNIVSLTPREHFIAHLLLYKIHKCKKTAYALWLMREGNSEQVRYKIKSSKIYQSIRMNYIVHFREHMNTLLQSEDYREKLGKSISLGMIESYKNGRIRAFSGKKHTDETKAKMSETKKINGSNSGERNSQFGKPRTDETKEKVRLALSLKPILECIHCGKKSNNKGMMNQHHFDKCKHKEAARLVEDTVLKTAGAFKALGGSNPSASAICI